jgi:hypothetical protein
MSNLAIRVPPNAIRLPDKGEWTNRFEIHSESSGRVYVVAQNIKTQKFGCSCPGYCTKRKCKHLIDGCNLTVNQIHGYNQLAAPKSRKGMR